MIDLPLNSDTIEMELCIGESRKMEKLYFNYLVHTLLFDKVSNVICKIKNSVWVFRQEYLPNTSLNFNLLETGIYG